VREAASLPRSITKCSDSTDLFITLAIVVLHMLAVVLIQMLTRFLSHVRLPALLPLIILECSQKSRPLLCNLMTTMLLVFSEEEPPPARPLPPPTQLDSLIILSFPQLFDEFRRKQFVLLWRRSRDDFRARDFPGRCDRHANALTLIFDKGGNIFGGFTPLQWESGDKWKCDDSLKSFLFTLKNPHNIPAKTFALEEEGSNAQSSLIPGGV
jgi:hypothetical protein